MRRSGRRLSGWGLVAAAAVAVGAAGVYQFGWSSIRLPLGSRLGAPEPALGTVFTLLIVFQTVGQFPVGWVRDRYGPRVPLIFGAVCLVAGFAGAAVARSLVAAYVAFSVGGLGVASAYTVAVNTPVKWFDDRRGLATGVVMMAYGGTSFLAIPLVRRGVTSDFERTLLFLAAGAGAASLLAAAVLRDPPGSNRGDAEDAGNRDPEDRSGDRPEPPGEADGRQWTWREAIQTWQFWLLYVVFVAVNGVGLMVIGKVVSFAAVLGLPETAGTASASVVALSDSLGVLVVGGLSDRFGRRHTVAASLVCCGLALAGAVWVGGAGIAAGFVALVGLAAFFRSPPFAVFPTIVGEYYGRARSSENYAALFTAKLFGGVLGGTVASALVVGVGWGPSFLLGALVIALAGVALTFLRPVGA